MTVVPRSTTIPASSSPDPEHPAKPDAPTQLTRRSWTFILRKTLREFSDDQCTDLAAALTYYAVLALFPALLALVSLLGLFGRQGNTDELLSALSDVGAGSIVDTVRGPLEQLTSSAATGFALVIGLGGALWSASGYVGAFGRAMNRIYEIDEGRPFWKLRPLMLVITLAAVILAALVAVGLVVSGPVAQSVGDLIGLGSTAVTVWSIAKWPVLLVLAALAVAILYYATPNVRQPKFRWLSVGAAVAIVTWVVASALFGLYVANFADYNKTYGSLAGVIIFLLWLWLTNLALLFGAELDAEMERGRQLQAGIAAEDEIQLPARDTRVIEKNDAKDEQDAARARALRHTAGRSDDPSEVPATTGTPGPNTDEGNAR
ncbi:YihY/virulence factor BrkB family protein [Nakamurella flava]|uniref:YihY/virulence factor BrkB family protein n=1 Tax=Nakamurella flava TaxID=2576308 RepID=UPI001F0F38D0|nr:YihY/virulence factor BrkB family protein [Nakamurella flava]